MKNIALFVAGMAAVVPTMTSPVLAGTTPYLGEIMLFGPNFCPRGWEVAEGQLLPISSNQALFSLMGTIYGGDGRTTFAMPDMRGRVAVGFGQGAGLRNYSQGQMGGAEETETNVQLSHHSHPDADSSVFVPGLVEHGAVTNVQPFTGLRYCIATEGVFPPRS
jgi:microcystin-dependent protein